MNGQNCKLKDNFNLAVSTFTTSFEVVPLAIKILELYQIGLFELVFVEIYNLF